MAISQTTCEISQIVDKDNGARDASLGGAFTRMGTGELLPGETGAAISLHEAYKKVFADPLFCVIDCDGRRYLARKCDNLTTERLRLQIIAPVEAQACR